MDTNMDADAESATAAFICTNVLKSGDTCMKGYNDKVSSLVILSLAQFISMFLQFTHASQI
jgi:hypothetical protein